MKANKAPEKIYVPTAGDELHYHMTCPNNEFQESIEYIRKDAFIEKAEKAIIEWAGTYISKTTGGGVRERKVLATDLLNYLKKYMEE